MFSTITLGMFWRKSRYAKIYRVMDICFVVLLVLLAVLTTQPSTLLSCAGVSNLPMP